MTRSKKPTDTDESLPLIPDAPPDTPISMLDEPEALELALELAQWHREAIRALTTFPDRLKVAYTIRQYCAGLLEEHNIHVASIHVQNRLVRAMINKAAPEYEV